MPSDTAPDIAPYMRQAGELHRCEESERGMCCGRCKDIARALHECAVRVRRETLGQAASILRARGGIGQKEMFEAGAQLFEYLAGSPPAAADPLADARAKTEAYLASIRPDGFTLQQLRACLEAYEDSTSDAVLLFLLRLLDSDGKDTP